MKNHLIFGTIMVSLFFVLSSFTKKEDVAVVAPQNWKTTCKDGRVYYFQCDCNHAQAQAIASLQCNPLKDNSIYR